MTLLYDNTSIKVYILGGKLLLLQYYNIKFNLIGQINTSSLTIKIMNLVKVKCVFCGKEFFRQKGRFNEAKKFNWKQYCSKKCLFKDRVKKRVLFCEHCGKAFKRIPSATSHHNYCSKSCAAIANNKRYPKLHPEAKLKVCIKCGQLFRKSTGNRKYCSIKCRRKAEWHTPEGLIEIIKNTVQKHGRIPARRELMGIDGACRKVFGSWNNAIITAGFQPNRSHSQRMYKRTNTVALDGHLCDSVSEALIDNWFTENDIFHKKNAPYPGTNYKTDWVIFMGRQSIFVEYFGLANDSPRYDRAIKNKQKLCQKHNIKLIEIYPQDLYPKKNLYKKLQDKFRKLVLTTNFGDSGLEPLFSRTRRERLTN